MRSCLPVDCTLPVYCVTLCRASVAVITDDPEHKSKLKESLSGVFNGRPFFLECLIYSLTFLKIVLRDPCEIGKSSGSSMDMA